MNLSPIAPNWAQTQAQRGDLVHRNGGSPLSAFPDKSGRRADVNLSQPCFLPLKGPSILKLMNTAPLPRPLTIYLVHEGQWVAARLLRLFRRIPNVACIGVGRYSSRTIAAVEAVQPDIVVLDIGAGHRDALHRLQSLREAARTAIVLLLAHGCAWQSRQRYLEAGADYCLDMTLQFAELMNCLQRLGKTSRSDDEVRQTPLIATPPIA